MVILASLKGIVKRTIRLYLKIKKITIYDKNQGECGYNSSYVNE